MLRMLLLVLASLAGGAFAATADVTRDTEGIGATQQEAVANALVEAVRQVRGSAAGVDRGVKDTLTVVASGGGTLLTQSQEPVADLYTVSRGYVRSYQVLEQRLTDKGVYVRIRAVVPTFESAVSDAGKKRIAVMPFRVTARGYTLSAHGDAVNFSQRLADALVAQLAQEPDVVLVNRDFFAEMGLEKAVLAADAAPAELTKLGASVGADFLLVGRVQEARSESETGAYGGKPKTTDEIRLAWRLVEAATGKLLGAGNVTLDKTRKNSSGAYGSTNRDDFEAGELFATLAEQVADAALAKPPRTAPAAAPAGAETELTPGSSDQPIQW